MRSCFRGKTLVTDGAHKVSSSSIKVNYVPGVKNSIAFKSGLALGFFPTYRHPHSPQSPPLVHLKNYSRCQEPGRGGFGSSRLYVSKFLNPPRDGAFFLPCLCSALADHLCVFLDVHCIITFIFVWFPSRSVAVPDRQPSPARAAQSAPAGPRAHARTRSRNNTILISSSKLYTHHTQTLDEIKS